MPTHSAGLLPYRKRNNQLEVFLAHPGGPYWKNKDEGAWMIIKGEFDEEEPMEAARREFKEETGFALDEPLQELEPVKQSGGKVVHAFVVEADLDPDEIESNIFEMEWPPKSGKKQSFPEIDRAAWFTMDEARKKMLKSQRPLLEQLEALNA